MQKKMEEGAAPYEESATLSAELVEKGIHPSQDPQPGALATYTLRRAASSRLQVVAAAASTQE